MLDRVGEAVVDGEFLAAADGYSPRLWEELKVAAHLPPLRPQSEVEMLLQRFDLYFEQPHAHGIRDIRAQDFYREIFPRGDIRLDELAFFFDYDRDPLLRDDALQAAHAELMDALEEWRALYVPNSRNRRRHGRRPRRRFHERRFTEGSATSLSNLHIVPAVWRRGVTGSLGS